MSINYLRISVTDLCNLRCFYCIPDGCSKKLDHNEILRYEEIEKSVDILSELGIMNFRITGGEPLVRKGITDLLEKLSKKENVKRLFLTTNLITTSKIIEKLNKIDISGINISIDTLNEKKYEKITGRNNLNLLMRNIDTLKNNSIKTNTVILKDINNNEIMKIAEFAQNKGYIPRFIEYMKINGNSKNYFVSSIEIIDEFIKKGFIKGKAFRFYEESAAIYYNCSNNGIIGFIMPESHKFCNKCSRLRLTSNGKLRVCLYSDKELDLKELLRSNIDNKIVKNKIIKLIDSKIHHENIILNRSMNSIGG